MATSLIQTKFDVGTESAELWQVIATGKLFVYKNSLNQSTQLMKHNRKIKWKG